MIIHLLSSRVKSECWCSLLKQQIPKTHFLKSLTEEEALKSLTTQDPARSPAHKTLFHHLTLISSGLKASESVSGAEMHAQEMVLRHFLQRQKSKQHSNLAVVTEVAVLTIGSDHFISSELSEYENLNQISISL